MRSSERPTAIMDKNRLNGTLNFRAVGAFQAVTGARLRGDWLYRSGTFENIGPMGGAGLRDLGIAAVIDLRSDYEITAHPAPLEGIRGLETIAPRHSIRLGDLSRVVHDPATTPGDVKAAMIRVYREIPAQFAPIFAQVFRHAANSRAPFVINCTAGKDRTGTAIALVLKVLGVDRDDIFTDYLLSNSAAPALRDMLRSARGGIDYERLGDSVIAPLHAADAEYLSAFFDQIDAQYGSVENYLTTVVGVSTGMRHDLTARLLG
jgi:protein-tyrosine phosphatase